jgi:hypothetical protein
MPNQAAIETLQSEMDEESDNNSIRSTMSHSVQNDISIPAPPLQDYADFIAWLSYNFASYFTQDFEHFVLREMMLLTTKELSDFVSNCVPKTLHQPLGLVAYDRYRPFIIEEKPTKRAISSTRMKAVK